MLGAAAKGRLLMWPCLSLILLLVDVDVWPAVEAFVNSPKIISKDGNLIFESGANRNISFRLSGNSRLTINEEYDVLELLLASVGSKKRPDGAKDEWSSTEDLVDIRELADQLADFQRRAFGSNGLKSMLQQQLNRTRGSRTLLRRYQVRLRAMETKVNRLETQLELNSCQSGPCENGGSCYNTYNGYRCQCRPAFEGAKCEIDVNECALYEGTDLACQNGAQCLNQFGSYSCLCLPGWHGMHCTQRKGDCSQASAWELCGHGACVPSSDEAGYRCLCEAGWKSNGLTPVCGEDVDECSDAAAHTPCSTKCINLPGSFTCAPCAAGLTGNGISCRDLDECEANNGGCSLSPRVDCLNTYGSHHCGECPVGWTGDGRTCQRNSPSGSSPGNSELATISSCSQRGSLCHPAANCFEISGTLVCSCPAGMVGTGYGFHGCVNGTANNCRSNPCLNNGICLDAGPSNFTCLCNRGFRPPLCEPLPNPCDAHPCKNGGRCNPTLSSADGFVCQCLPGYRDRLCSVRFSSCNAMLSAESGRLRYPPEGTGYEHNAQCAWVIRTNESLVLNVTFSSFDLEDSTECRFDWLQINDGRSAAAQILGRYCGNHLPHGGSIISSGNQLYLWFRSDNTTSREGFDLSWVSMEPQCGGRLEFETHGTLASPGSPGNYPKNRDCRWHLVAPTSKRIKLTFFSLQLEQHTNCNFDYVEIMDSISNRQLAKFCSSVQPAPLLLPTHEALIQFHSDADGSDSGFQLHYSVEERVPGCGGIYTSKEGSIRFSSLASDVPMSCEYEIRLAVGESVGIEFVTFEMDRQDCLELYDVAVDGTSLLQAKHCGESSGTPPSFRSLFNRVRIKAYASRGRFQLHYRILCSYTFDSDSGTVLSPGYPNLTTSDTLCTYTITTAPSKYIVINRRDFQLEDGPQTSDDDDDDDDQDDACLGTSLRMNVGINRQILGPYCGKRLPDDEFISQTNHLILQLQTDSSSRGRGFKFDYQTVDAASDHCGGVHTKEGNIRLPVDGDGQYANDLTCYWVIQAPARKAIRLHWVSMELESSSDCSYDHVEIFDSMDAYRPDAKPLARYCSSALPEDFVTQARMLTIKFKSDYSSAYDGFELAFSFVDTDSCGGHIHASSGELSSPGYPMNYSADLDCAWQLTVALGHLVEVQLEIFDLESSANCSRDYLEVRNGGHVSSPLIGRFCGSQIPTRIPSFSNELRLVFHTDAAVSGHGFRLRWRVFANRCGGRLSSNDGAITSPRYPNNYPHNMHCEWQVRVHPGSAVQLLIEDMQLESSDSCSYDNVLIFTGDRHLGVDPKLKICDQPDESHRALTFDGNAVDIFFNSDVNNAMRGFRISYTTNCRRNVTATYGTIESLNYMEPYWDQIPINCSWTIRAPRGNRIRLEVSHMERHEERLPTALPGGVYLIDGGSLLPLLGPGAHNASGDVVTLVHNASNVNFQLEYRIDGCLQEFRAESGSFQSPNHPGMYPNSLECYWLINVQMGDTIELTVTNLDLEESVNCTKDALTVSNHEHETYVHERHCGATPQLVLTSAGHRMHIRFIADGSHNGRGFEATYRTVRSKCGGKMSGRNGVIQSPNYPMPYPEQSHCEWLLEVSPHHRIVFDVQDMEIESGFECSWDYLEAFDINGGDDDTEGRRLFKVCNSFSPEAPLMSGSNAAMVRFVSDDSVSHAGFRLHFHESCGQQISIDDTDFEYLSLERQAARNETCLWVLQASDPGKHIIFTATSIKLRPEADTMYPLEGDCLPVGVKIYDGPEAAGTPRLKFCRSHPPAIISNGQSLTISLPLLLVEEFEGHFMTMDTACGSLYTAMSGRFSSPYYPDSYPPNIECIWVLSASQGNSLSLTIESMDLEQSDGCNRDYMEVREEFERGPLIGVYCGNQVPGAIHSRGSIWIKFKSDDDNVGEGFMASYNYERHNELNGTDGVVQSPQYPSKFQTSDPFSWRITVDKNYVVVISVLHLRDLDQPHLRFYDGYSDIGAPLEAVGDEAVRSSTNMVYFTASRGPFKLSWQRLSKESLRSNRTAQEQTRHCGQQLLSLNQTMFTLNSPGYPGGYENGLQCAWTLVPVNPAMHAVFQLVKLDLELFGSNECIADYLQVSQSADMQTWTEQARLCAEPNLTSPRIFHGSPYLKMEFITDMSVNKTGFNGAVRTECGSELSSIRGLVNVTESVLGSPLRPQECVWKLRVRQGRRIRIDFPDFQMDSANAASPAPFGGGGGQPCGTFLMVRNGYAADSPFLGRGKYCDSGIGDVLETTSNRAYIKFRYQGYPRFRVSFRFEELGHACSGRIVLGPAAGEQQVITSPNYPNLPNPHSECVWLISAPPQHRISVQFFGNFDLTPATGAAAAATAAAADPAYAAECDREFIQMNDGSTELKPQLGRFCGNRKPDTIYSSGSQLRIRYYTEVPEPLYGFQARLSIARCGGSYFSPEGEISSPTPAELKLHSDQGMALEECVYTIEVDKGNTIELESERLQLPQKVADNCSHHTHLRLEEMAPFGLEGEEHVIDTLLVCGTSDRRLLVETNKIVVRLRLIDGELQENQGFRFRYKAIGSRCGEKIEAMQGVLQSPGYPDGVTHPMHCVWRLQVPKGRRVRVEILDFNTGGETSIRESPVFRGRLTFANDHKMQSILGRYSADPPAEIISSDNTMGIDAFLLPFSRHRGFKLRFTAYGESECRGLNIREGQPGEALHFERHNLSSLVHCSYNLSPPPNATILLQVLQYNSSSAIMRNEHICGLLSPLKLSRPEQSEPLLSHLLCGFLSIGPGDSVPTVRVPFPIQLTVSGSVRNELKLLRLGYSMQSCGGIWPLEPGDNLTIRQPFGMSGVAGAIDCAWAIGPDMDASGEDGPSPQDIQLEVSLTVHLPNAEEGGAGAGAGAAGGCHKQFLKVYNGPDQNSPSLGVYCDQPTDLNLVVERGLFLEYHADRYVANSTFNVSIKYGSGCGGKLSYPYRHVDFSEQYKNNVECVWEVESEPGYHIGLSFLGRFYIEDSTGCTKDYLLVQQRNDSSGNWTDLQRICGRAPPQQINTTAPFMRLIFRSDGDVVGDGFVAKFERNCGGTLYATSDEQELTNPGYPGYDKNLMCSWTFVPRHPHAAGVLISFLQFDLEQAPISVCQFDNVTVVTRDSGDRVQQATICGVKQNHEYRAKQSIDLTLRTDSSYNGRGFRLVYSTQLCGGVISESGVLASPRQHTDDKLPPNSDCYWNLTAPAGHKFTIKFELIDFEAHSSCSYDGVEVFAGAVPNERMRAGRFCGHITENLPTLSVGGDRALIHSYSDDRDPSRGFRALVRVLKNCDAHIHVNSSQRYQFDMFFGQEGYEHNLDCNIVFAAAADQQLSVEFRSFHVEQAADCGKDFVELRDGAGPFAELIGKFCGQDQPPILITTRHTLFLRFFTNADINDSGFEMYVTSKPRLCGSPEIRLDSTGLRQATLSSPAAEPGGNSGNGNGNGVACFWKIVGDAALNLEFVSFDIQGPDANGSCVADYLKIYNNEDALMVEQGYGSELIFNGHTSGLNMLNYAAEHVYCGSGKPDTYYANANEVYLKFRTNGAVTRPGFQIRASLDSDCQRHYGGLQGRVRLSETADCDVYIRAPANYTLSLYHAELVFSSFDCEQENMEVFDRNNQSLQRLCSYLDPGKSIFSQTNELRLHIKTGSYLSRLDLTYLASPIAAGPGCGGQFYNTEGIFTNPFYPDNVRNNSDCRWTVRVPSNNRVLLFFESFNLGSRSTCHTDYVQILEMPASGSGEQREMRRFCGDDAPRVYKSQSSQLDVRFHKTVNYDGVGWVIKFSSVYSNYQIPAYMLSASDAQP